MKARPISAAILLVLGVALSGLTNGLAHAVDASTPRSRAHSADEITQRRVTMRLQNLASKLDLTDDQKSALRPMLEAEANELRAVRMNTSITPEDQEAQFASIHERHREQLRSVLTPAQQIKLDELRNEARARLNETGQKRKGRVPVMPDND